MDQEPTEDVLTWACYWESCGCCGFFACLFLPAAVSYFSRFLILHTWTVFQIVLDGIIGQTIHFACVPKFLHILKVKLIWRQFEYNGGCTDLFLWEMIPFEGQGVAGPALIKEGNTLPIQVSYHTRNLSSSSVLLENSIHKHRYQRTDSNTSCLLQVDSLMGYFLWVLGQADIPVAQSRTRLSFHRFSAQ